MKPNFFIYLLLLSIPFMSFSQSIIISDVSPRRVEGRAFSLKKNQDLTILGAGGVFRDDYRLLVYYAWILNADTREVVWHLFDDYRGGEFKDRNGIIDFEKKINLPSGNYELYFTGAYDHRNWNVEWTISSFDELVEELFDSRNRIKFSANIKDDLFVKISAGSLTEESIDDFFTRFTSKAEVFFARAKDDESFEQGITLTDQTNLRIYSLGEGSGDEAFDHAWIVNAVTRERVFDMNYRNTRFAGGAEKNLKIDTEITLPAGSYIVKYVTDDSHSYEEWNALPPDDPQFWGVSVFGVTAEDKRNFTAFDPPKNVMPVLEMTGVSNDQLITTGFNLTEDMELRVLCIGEGDAEDLVDYGWIVDANTRQTVWNMKGYRTVHAGGAKKNRLQEEIIKLPKGEYIAYYVTDDSHAFGSWNASHPSEEDYWGLTLWAVNEADFSKVMLFDPESYTASNELLAITKVGNDHYENEILQLDKETKITIIAIGEGQERGMFDYGWVKNMDNGKVVWEMEYQYTKHAGGAEKNRMITQSIILPKGEYKVYFETDDSHAFGKWNDEPPHDPQNYGIRILVE